MTDQRPIDPSTLRDGEYVRADGDGWAVEGRVTFVLGDPCVDLGNYCQGIRRAVITRLPAAPEPDPVCPFPMGARVVQPGGEEANVIGWEYCAECGRWEVQVDIGSGSDRWAAGALTLAPEPAPIEVGDWWADEGGWPCVVVKIGPTGNPFLRRWTSEHPDKAPSPETLLAAWTRLDGPPEPPVGSVGTVGPVVFEVTADGVEITGSAHIEPWPAFCKRYGTWLATLQIVHTLGVE